MARRSFHERCEFWLDLLFTPVHLAESVSRLYRPFSLWVSNVVYTIT
jgi:hypothetical protein